MGDRRRSYPPPLYTVLGIVVGRGEVVDVFEGFDRGEFLRVTLQLTSLDVDPPFGIDVPNAVDEDVVWGGTEGWGVVSEGEGHFVAVKNAGVVEAVE